MSFQLKSVLGIVFLILSSSGLLANLIVALPVFKFAFMKEKSTIFLLSAFHIFFDTVRLVVICFYLAPGIIMDSYIFSDSGSSPISIFISSIIPFCWLVSNITFIVIALNRLFIICYRNGQFFSRRNLCTVFILTICFSAMKTYFTQYVLPCCAFIIDQSVLSYSYLNINNLPNWTDTIDMPFNALTSITICVCYSLVFRNIRQSRKCVEDKMKSDEQKRRRKRELSYAIQFSIISIFYTIGWIIFRIFPKVIKDRGVEWYILSAFFQSCNCSANAIVYLLGNKEVKNYLSGLFFRRKQIDHPATREVSPIDARISQIQTINHN